MPTKDKHIQDTATRYKHAHGHGMLLYLDLAKIPYYKYTLFVCFDSSSSHSTSQIHLKNGLRG